MSWPLARTFGRRSSPLLLSGSFLYLLRSGARASGLGETRRFFLSVFLRFSFFSALHFSGLGREGAASTCFGPLRFPLCLFPRHSLVMKTPGNARGVPPLVLLQTRLAKCNFRPADVAPLVLLFALALLAAFSALVDAFTRTTVTGRRFPFGSLGNSWSRASSPGQLTVLRWFRWFAWGVWSIASPMSTGRPRGRWRDGVRRRHPNWRACSCFLCHAFGFWRKRHSRLCFHFLFHFFVGGLRRLFL